jgi:transposase
MEQIDALVARGYSIEAAAAELGVTVSTYMLWLAERGNQIPVTIDRLEHLQGENSKLRKALAKVCKELEALRRGNESGSALAHAA